MKPITRQEKYLAKLAGDSTVIVPIPITREEIYLAIMCGGNYAIPKPVTRIEKYLSILCGEDAKIPEPKTRLEAFIAYAAGYGQKDVIKNPIQSETLETLTMEDGATIIYTEDSFVPVGKPKPITRMEIMWDNYIRHKA